VEFQNIGKVKLTKQASLLENVDRLGKTLKSVNPLTFEELNQFSGFVHYKTVLSGNYEANALCLDGLCDRAHIFIDKKLTSILYRNDQKTSIELPPLKKGTVIEILVEAMGRVNYGPELYDRKGIRQGVRIGNQYLFGWENTPINVDLFGTLNFSKTDCHNCPVILKGEFLADPTKDCFVHFDGFKKGIILVNGFNLGRYWEIGPQRSLYIPAPILKEQNEITVLELDGYENPAVTINGNHILG